MGADRIPFLDLRQSYLELRAECDAAYRRFMESGRFVLGPETISFEEEYATYCRARWAIGVSNGLDALTLTLRALGVSSGDEVLVPSNTYIATWLAVSHVGATPVAVEPRPDTMNIDPEALDDAISESTRVILAVNLYGQPCDYRVIGDIARRRGLKFVVDNAQAQGAVADGAPVGGLADAECHSFYPSKNLGAFGEAGAVTTNDEELADRVRLLRNYGSKERYLNEVQGFNCRIDELQAAFLRVKLKHLNRWNTRRREIAETYLSGLRGVDPRLELPEVARGLRSVWHQFVIRHPERDRLRGLLDAAGVDTLIHYPVPPHLSDAYSGEQSFRGGPLPVSEKLAREVLSLPIDPSLTDQQVEAVVSRLRHVLVHDLA